AGDLRIVEAAVGVLLDDPGRGHVTDCPKDGAAQHGAVQQGLQAGGCGGCGGDYRGRPREALRQSRRAAWVRCATGPPRTAERPAEPAFRWVTRVAGLTSPCGGRR